MLHRLAEVRAVNMLYEKEFVAKRRTLTGSPLNDKRRLAMRKLDSAFGYFGAVIGIVLTASLLAAAGTSGDKAPTKLLRELKGPFDLAGDRTHQVQYFRMETKFVHIGFDGRRTGMETYVLKLRCVPAPLSGKGADEYTCGGFE
jgi:hypothetical protein